MGLRYTDWGVEMWNWTLVLLTACIHFRHAKASLPRWLKILETVFEKLEKFITIQNTEQFHEQQKSFALYKTPCHFFPSRSRYKHMYVCTNPSICIFSFRSVPEQEVCLISPFCLIVSLCFTSLWQANPRKVRRESVHCSEHFAQFPRFCCFCVCARMRYFSGQEYSPPKPVQLWASVPC